MFFDKTRTVTRDCNRFWHELTFHINFYSTKKSFVKPACDNISLPSLVGNNCILQEQNLIKCVIGFWFVTAKLCINDKVQFAYLAAWAYYTLSLVHVRQYLLTLLVSNVMEVWMSNNSLYICWNIRTGKNVQNIKQVYLIVEITCKHIWFWFFCV